MAIIQLEEANATGTLQSVKLRGSGTANEVRTTGEVDAALDQKTDKTSTSNIDNTSDADKPVSTAQQAAIDAKLDHTGATILNFAPTTDSAHVAGNLWYDSESQALTFDPDVDMSLNLGQEEVIRVINNTGATIPNATAVYQSGVSAGLPEITPGDAAVYASGTIPGITTHEIANGAEGFITHAGRVGGDFSAYAVGDVLYLAEGGGMTTTAPDLVTVLGTVLDNGVDGSMLVRINSHAAVPTVLGFMNNVPGTVTADVAYTNIANYQTSGGVVMAVDPVTGILSIPYNGTYRITSNFSLTIAASTSGSRSIQMQLYNITDGGNIVYNLPVPRDETQVSGSFAIPFDALASDQLVMRHASADVIPGVTFTMMTFDVESIHLG